MEDGSSTDSAFGSPDQPDCWRLSPIVFTSASALGAFLLCGWPGSINLFAIPLTLLGGPIVLLIIFVVAVRSFVIARWRTSICLMLAVIAPIALRSPLNWMADCIHLGLTVGLGIGELADGLPGGERFDAHDWSVGLVSNPSTFLLYDSTDGLAGPPRPARHDWSNATIEDNCTGRSEHLIGHYYVCSF